jgi:hypothetical protein
MVPTSRWRGFFLISLLTFFALAVHGYHPFAEDGGLYAAEIKHALNPALYGQSAFVTQHLPSVFALLVAGITRLTRLNLEWVLFLLYILTLWITLYAASTLVSRTTISFAGRYAAMALLACWLTLPIAGTSLMLFDPYLTARSLTTPLILFGLAGLLDTLQKRSSRARSLMPLTLLAAALLHPLMAAYGFAAIVLTALFAIPSRTARRRGVFAAIACAFAIAAVVQASAPPESADYLIVERTRYYWFLSQWHCYELLGLIAPLILLRLLARREASLLARGAILLGSISIAVSLSFAHLGYATHLVARLQPLRSFLFIYIIMILLLGAWLGEHLLQSNPWRWAAMILLCGAPLFFVARSTYPASAHVEFPGLIPPNPWQQAFLWVRSNTPKDALFAMNPHYIQAHAEDAQSFRAIAERDALPDYSKDGGQAAILPSLTPLWIQGQAAQSRIDEESDAERRAALKAVRVSWVVLQTASLTLWQCPYRNSTVKVCSVP